MTIVKLCGKDVLESFGFAAAGGKTPFHSALQETVP
jgi:hypothetical protein